MLPARLVTRLYADANAAQWRVDADAFALTLEASAARAFAGRSPEPAELDRYLSGLHLEDLALACACAAGDEEAWQHFVLTYRPALYRAADAIDPGGGARDLADSIYAELFGLKGGGGERQALFRYFHGRSSVVTWLRSILAQRHVDRIRERRRTEPIPDDDSPAALGAPASIADPERSRFLALMRAALTFAVALLDPKDRLRLACYYAQQMTLAQVGRLLGEHEATVSRQLARTRVLVRRTVEQHLTTEHGLTDPQVSACFATTADDAGPLDLRELFAAADISLRKETAADRSKVGRP